MKVSESTYSGCIYFASGALARKIEKLAAASWKSAGLSPSHGYLLMLVIKNPGIQPGNIANELQLEPSTITRLIQKLEAKKLIIRITEGKIANVYPTPSAKKMLPKLLECVNDFSARHSLLLKQKETEKLLETLHNVSDKL